MNPLQKLMYNEGERLVPYVSHDDAELVRHRSSYAFFHRVIASDLSAHNDLHETKPLSIVDLGSGTGYGCSLLSSLPDALITGVDIACECKDFATQYYARTNVDYIIDDLTNFIPNMPTYDYAVSRGVLEHVPNGLKLIGDIKYARRALIDVPYDEAGGNQHHVITNIRENEFDDLPNREIFYEDLEGNIFDVDHKPARPNLILVVLSASDLPKISTMFTFPIPAVHDDELEQASRSTSGGRFNKVKREDLLEEVARVVRETDIVADIGCGIVPMNYFRPKMHFMVEPWKEYADILSYRHRDDKSIFVLRTGALEALKSFSDKSIDSIFLLDVIEHLPKDTGFEVIAECERVAREQIVVFTPLGFMPQHMEKDQTDGWGLSGASVQEHLSGWTPEDFGSLWSFYVCDDFHQVDFKRDSLEKSYGAFFAIRNFDKVESVMPAAFSELRRPLPSEIEAAVFKAQVDQTRASLSAVDSAYKGLLNSRSVRLIQAVKNILNFGRD